MATSKVDFAKVHAKLAEISEGFVKNEAKVGWFSSAHYPDGTPVAYVALIQELGAPAVHIPPRPFIRPTIKAQRDVWAKLLRDGAKAVIKGKFTAYQVLEGVGMQSAGDIRKTITQVESPPLKESTIKARARLLASKEITASLEKPLIATRLMMNSTTNVVGPKK